MQVPALEKAFLNNLTRLCSHPDKYGFLLAVSGGVDSMVLLNLFHRFNLAIEIAHCNFCLRGDESDQDEAIVLELANTLNIPVHIKRFESLKEMAGDHSIQLMARELRYSWFKDLLSERKLDYLVLAHHADDNLETALYNFTKGTSLKGLKGMPEFAEHMLRPLLHITKSDILNYAKEQSIPYRNDQSNESLKYNRNLIRHNVIPELNKINPKLSATFAKHAALYNDAIALIEQVTHEFLEKHTCQNQDTLIIELEALEKLPGKLNILLSILEPYGFSYTQVINILEKQNSNSGKKILSQSHRLIFNRNELIVAPLNIDAFSAEINTIPICIMTPFGSLIFEKLENQNNKTEPDKNIIYLKADTPLPFTIRTKEKGDIFYPEGMAGKKQKLKDYFINNKFSIPEKEKQLLLLSKAQICWVIGCRGDERFIELNKNKAAIKLSWIPN